MLLSWLNRSSIRKTAKYCLLLTLIQAPAFYCSLSKVSAQSDSTLSSSSSSASFSQQYTELTKKVLLAGIELERFSLNFRLANANQPKYRKLRYFLSQETGASCALAFEITGDKQFGNGKNHPLQISKHCLHHALNTAMIGSIVAASGSGIELGLNAVHEMKNRKNGIDHNSATKFVVSKLKTIDSLLAQREALVAANADSPVHDRALVEGKVLHELRNCFVNEFSQFNADTANYLAFQNLFFFLNASYNTVGALAARFAYNGVNNPKFNGTANILFIVSGGLAAVSPFLSTVGGKLMYKHAYDSFQKQIGEKPKFDPAALSTECKLLQSDSAASPGSLIPSLPATERFALYSQSDELFRKQLDSETQSMRKLDKVAVQTSLLGPAIGSCLFTQGILGTVGYYKYPIQPRKQLTQVYHGSVVGTVGAGMAVVGNAAWLLASMSYEHKLAKEKRLPEQLINDRLQHLDDLQKTISAL